MQIPQSPPNSNTLGDGVQPNRLYEIFQAVGGPTTNGRYLHWDKLRYMTPPSNLTHSEWWWGLKLARRSQRKVLPLRSTDGRSFSFGTPDPMPELLHQLDQKTGGMILTDERAINPSVRDQYIVRSLIEEAITSSQLEGAATTREVAQKMLRTGRQPRDRSEQMIMNNYMAMQEIRKIKDEPLSPKLVFDLHRILARDTLDNPAAVGRFRLPNEEIRVEDQYGEVLHTPPPAGELEKRLAAMCAFANEATPDYFVHPVIRAIILHFWLAYDHPFVDGNGRSARALFYWSMLNSGYWLCEFISISQIVRKAPVKYVRAFLYTETDENDLTYFILYHLELLKKGIESLHAYMEKKAHELREAEALVRASAHFNHRQLALLSYALRHPNANFTIAEHQTSHNVVHQTAREDLFGLAKAGLLEPRKRGRTYIFSPPPNFQEKLRQT